MALPVHEVTWPAVLAGQSNGRLPDSILFDTPGQAGGATVRMVQPAARAWRALQAAALAAGHVLKLGWATSSYRSYAQQEVLFRSRYTTTVLEGRPRKWWNGEWWYQKPNTAVAAVPGTSDHGWGLADDVGEESDGDVGTESIDAATLGWLVAHEFDFGYSHEVQSEPWHIRYWAGDDIPAAVFAYEEGDDVALSDRDAQILIWRMEAVLHNRPAVNGGPTAGERNDLHFAIAAAGKVLTPEQLALVGAAAKGGAEKGVADTLDGATLTTTINVPAP